MNSGPMISVVMPVYNGEKFLREAIESILNQTFKFFEFLIIYDDSDDNTLPIIQEFQEQDKRIVLINGNKEGITGALNKGIKKAKGKYIARMDADDISLPERFEKQINCLNKDSIDLISTGYEKIDIYGESTGEVVLHPSNPEVLKLLLVFCSPICHPSVMGKRQVFQEYMYRSGVVAEDHDLWCRIVLKYKVSNLEIPLLMYRVHLNSLSRNNRKAIRKSTLISGFRLFKMVYGALAKLNFSLVVRELSKYPAINLRRAKVVLRLAKLSNFFSI